MKLHRIVHKTPLLERVIQYDAVPTYFTIGVSFDVITSLAEVVI